MRNKTVVLTTLLFLGIVILPGFSMSSNGGEKPTTGCGKIKADLDDRLDLDNVAHLYFHQVDELFEGKKDGQAWAKMSYTFCGVPSWFVFNGHSLERGAPYTLIASMRTPDPVMIPTPMPVLLGQGMSNNGGNLHLKGAMPAEEGVWDIYLVRPEMWDQVVLAGDGPATWSEVCETAGVCDQGALFAELTGGSEVPPVMTEAAGRSIFYDNRDEDQLAFIIQASNIGTVIGAHVHLGMIDSNGPAVASLFTGSDGAGDFLFAGMVTEADLMDGFAGSPVSVLISAMDEGRAYVNVHTETWPAGEIRGQIGRIDIGEFCDGDDDDDYCDDDCLEECLEDCLDGDPAGSLEECKDECTAKCGEKDCEDECESTVSPDDPYYDRFEGNSYGNSCETDEDCIVSGCSSEVCAAESVATTCEALPYQPEGGCLCVEGVCQWGICEDL
jgi:eight-cysteine-cluster-containing protein